MADLLCDEVALGVRQVEARRGGQAEIDEVDPLVVGPDVAEVSVHVQQLAATQERHDLEQLPLEGPGLADRRKSECADQRRKRGQSTPR